MVETREWYEAHRFVKEKEAKRIPGRSVRCQRDANNRAAYFLIDSDGKDVGKLDPTRGWVRKFILAEESQKGGLSGTSVHVEEDDGSCHTS